MKKILLSNLKIFRVFLTKNIQTATFKNDCIQSSYSHGPFIGGYFKRIRPVSCMMPFTPRFYYTSGKKLNIHKRSVIGSGAVIVNSLAFNVLLGFMFVRNFSVTYIKYAGCDGCGGRHALLSSEKDKLKLFGVEFTKNKPVPVITEAEKIKSEKAEDLAAAYERDLEALKARKEEIRSAFDKATGKFANYFKKEKYKYAKEELDIDTAERGIKPVCPKVVDVYLEKTHQDPDRVFGQRLNEDNKGFANLSREAYKTMRDSVNKHTKAEYLIKKRDPSIKEGNPEKIDKDLFRKDLSVAFSEDKPENSSSESKAENSSEVKAENSSKRSFEQAGESSNDSANKRAKTENKSAIDYILEKQNCEMPDTYESDGGE